MKILKHILIVIALLATSLPCSHAFVHHGHDHDAQAVCDYTAAACECHSCDQEPCTDPFEIQLKPASGIQHMAFSPKSITLFICPEPLSVLHHKILPTSGALASIQTIQLLI